MNIVYSLFLIMENMFLILFLFTWWFKIAAFVTAVTTAFIFHLLRIKRLKNEKSDLERQLLERNELLVYSSKNEQKANDKLAMAERNKGLLMSKLNHEIRTPMNGILGMCTLLNDTNLTDEQQEYNSTIISSGQSLLKVINEIMMNDILEYSKVELGKELEVKDVDLANCIEEVLDVFAVKAAKAGIDLVYDIADNVPPQILGDVMMGSSIEGSNLMSTGSVTNSDTLAILEEAHSIIAGQTKSSIPDIPDNLIIDSN